MHLQQILGTDKTNPCFTICQCDQTQQLHVYYGGDLLETVPDDRDHPQYKLAVARLRNAGISTTRLQKIFQADRKTIQRRADALKNNDKEELIRVLAGRTACRKLTAEIQAYVKMRFPKIYAVDRRCYSQNMRAEIDEVFRVSISAETLRPLFKKLRAVIDQERGLDGESSCDKPIDQVPDDETEYPIELANLEPSQYPVDRKESPHMPPESAIRFVHHLGVLLFSPILINLRELGGEFGCLLQQWLAAVLLGAVNIEQSKLLDMDSLQRLIEKTMKSRSPQRKQLAEMAAGNMAEKLYR